MPGQTLKYSLLQILFLLAILLMPLTFSVTKNLTVGENTLTLRATLPTVYALNCTKIEFTDGTVGYRCDNNETYFEKNKIPGFGTDELFITNAEATADASAAKAAGVVTIDSGNLFDKGCYVNPWTWDWCLASWYHSLIYTPSAGLLAISGQVMDVMVGFSLSKDVIDSAFVQEGWKSTRDLANMFFIFILLFVAIATILQLSSYGAKSLLAKLVVVALLINFSLFISRVIIDSGNITAMFFYDAIAMKGVSVPGVHISGIELKSLSAGLVNGVNPQNFASPGLFEKWAKDGQHLGEMFVAFLLGTGVNLVMAWALITIAFLFVARVAILWFLMAVAPLAFVAMILPQTNKLAQKWWGELFSKTFCITVFMFFLWLILVLINSKSLEKFIENARGGSFFEIIVLMMLNFSVIIVLIVMAKKITEKMCGEIEGVSLSIGSKLAGIAGLALGGVGGGLLRNTVGRGMSALARNEKFENWAGKSRVGGMLHKGTRGIAGASFDARKLPGAGAGGFGKASGKGGFAAAEAKRITQNRAYGESLQSDAAKIAYGQRLQRGVTIPIFNKMITTRAGREAGAKIESKGNVGIMSATVKEQSAKLKKVEERLSHPISLSAAERTRLENERNMWQKSIANLNTKISEEKQKNPDDPLKKVMEKLSSLEEKSGERGEAKK